MKIGSFKKQGEIRVGAFEDDRVIDLNAAYEASLRGGGESNAVAKAAAELPADLLALIERGDDALSAAEKAVEYAQKSERSEPALVHSLSDITFTAPLRPPKIVCTGTNYEDYRKLIGIDYAPVPLIFLKSSSAVIGHEEAIRLPKGYGVFYHE